MVTNKALRIEWQGGNLYQRRGPRAEYVGVVIKDSFKESWMIWNRGQFEGNRSTEQDARLALEQIACGKR